MAENSQDEHQLNKDQENIGREGPVLVAIDFSDDARAALLWACRFADCNEAQLVLLHVVHDPASSPGFYHSEDQDQMRPMQDVAENMMAEFVAGMIREHPGLDLLNSADTRLVTGLPPGRIVETAKLLNARLIVIGSRGMTGLPHLMLGSVAERVVELSTKPVVVVKAKNRKITKKKKKEKSKKKFRKQMKEEPEKQDDAIG